VTHDQDEALEVADRIVVMNQGHIEQVGTPDEVFHNPVSEFVMDFLGNVNLFHGRIEDGKPVVGGTSAGEPARVFARPHDLDIRRNEDGRPAIRARVVRIQSAGPSVKLELIGETGDPIVVEMPHDKFRETPIQIGDDVFVGLREARVFLEDYSI
jgi:sulfate transport system ATP-binding protein